MHRPSLAPPHLQYALTNSAWRTRSMWAGGVILLGLLLASTGGHASDGRLEPTLETSGTSILFDKGTRAVTPIYSIVFGDVTRADMMARRWHQTFGPYAVDAVIWTPTAGSGGLWKATDLRRPSTEEELARFSNRPDTFRIEWIGPRDTLPPPLNRLADGPLSQIEYVVCYRAGGIRVALAIGISRESALVLIQLFRALQV